MAVRHLLLCAGEASFLLRFPRHEMWKGDSSCFFLFATVDANKKPPESQGFKWFSLDGAAIQIRTGDLILTKDALYQLSYSSTITAQLFYHKNSLFASVFCKKIRFFCSKAKKPRAIPLQAPLSVCTYHIIMSGAVRGGYCQGK